MDMDMLAAPKKIVAGLTEVFQGFVQMFQGVSEQLELLAILAAEAEKEAPTLTVNAVLPADMPLPADVSVMGVTIPRPRKKPVKRHKVSDNEPVEETAAEPEGKDASNEGSDEPAETTTEEGTAEEADSNDSDFPVDTAELPWEEKAPPDKTTEQLSAKSNAVTLTKDDITSVIVAKIKQKRSNNEKIGQLLKAYGVGALSDLPAEKYEAFLTDISQL